LSVNNEEFDAKRSPTILPPLDPNPFAGR
jgi:hypothetical protein